MAHDIIFCNAIRDALFPGKLALLHPRALPDGPARPIVRCRWAGSAYYAWRDSPLLGGPPAFGGHLHEYGIGATVTEAYADFCQQQHGRIWPYPDYGLRQSHPH